MPNYGRCHIHIFIDEGLFAELRGTTVKSVNGRGWCGSSVPGRVGHADDHTALGDLVLDSLGPIRVQRWYKLKGTL